MAIFLKRFAIFAILLAIPAISVGILAIFAIIAIRNLFYTNFPSEYPLGCLSQFS